MGTPANKHAQKKADKKLPPTIRFIFFILFLTAVTALTIQAQSTDDPYFGDMTRYWVQAPLSFSGGSGEIAHCTVESNYLKTYNTVGLNVYLPPGYNENPGMDFPVIYLLHGVNGNENNYFSWFDNNNAVFNQPSIISEIEQRPVAQQAIVVWVNGGKGSFYNDFADDTGYGPSSDFPILSESVIMNEIIPFVDGNFRTIASREGRAIEGFSMGARGALKFAFKYSADFCSAISYGAAAFEEVDGRFVGGDDHPAAGELPDADKISTIVTENAAAIRANGLDIWLVNGQRDDRNGGNKDLAPLLTSLNIPYNYDNDLPNGHDWADYHRNHVDQGYQFHLSCFADAQARPQQVDLSRQSPINVAFALLAEMNEQIYLPQIIRAEGSCE